MPLAAGTPYSFKDDEVTSEMTTPTHESDYRSSYLCLHTSLQRARRRPRLKQRSARNMSCSLNLMWKSKREYSSWLFHTSVLHVTLECVCLIRKAVQCDWLDLWLGTGMWLARWVLFWGGSLCVSASVPGHEIKFGTSILDYPCGLWDTLINENDSTWSEGQMEKVRRKKKRGGGLNRALAPPVLSNFMVD